MSSLPIKDLGPCQVLYNSVDLGSTFGGVQFTDEQKYKELHTDQMGETIVDAVFTGREAKVVAKLTMTSLANLDTVIASSTAGATNLKVSASVGTAMYASANELILKPMVDGVASSTTSEWLHCHKAYPISKVDWGYDATNQRIVEVTFICFPSQATATLNEIWRIGPAS